MVYLTNNNLNLLNKNVSESFDVGSKFALEQALYPEIADVYTTTNWDESFTSNEGVSGGAVISENQNYPEDTVLPGYLASGVTQQHASNIVISQRALSRASDMSVILNREVPAQTKSGIINHFDWIENSTHAFLNNGFTDATLSPDGTIVFGLHTWNSSALTFNNSSTLAFSEAALAAMEQYGGAFKDATGKPAPIKFNRIIVQSGGAASRLAKQILFGNIFPPASTGVNIYNNGRYELIESPYITSSTAWFATTTDPRYEMQQNPISVGIRQKPTLLDGIVSASNRSVSYGVTTEAKFYLKQLPISWYGSTGLV